MVIRRNLPFGSTPARTVPGCVSLSSIPFFHFSPRVAPSAMHVRAADLSDAYAGDVPKDASRNLFIAACDRAVRDGNGNAAITNAGGLVVQAIMRSEAWRWSENAGRYGVFPSTDGVLTPSMDPSCIDKVESTHEAACMWVRHSCSLASARIASRTPEITGIDADAIEPESTLSIICHDIAGHRAADCALSVSTATGLDFIVVWAVFKACILYGLYIISLTHGKELDRFRASGPALQMYWNFVIAATRLGEGVRTPSIALESSSQPPPVAAQPAPTTTTAPRPPALAASSPSSTTPGGRPPQQVHFHPAPKSRWGDPRPRPYAARATAAPHSRPPPPVREFAPYPFPPWDHRMFVMPSAPFGAPFIPQPPYAGGVQPFPYGTGAGLPAPSLLGAPPPRGAPSAAPGLLALEDARGPPAQARASSPHPRRGV